MTLLLMKFNFLVRTKIEIVYTYKLVNKGNQWLWWNNLKQKQYFKKWSRKTEHLFLTPLLWSKLTPTKHYGKFLKTYHIYLLLPKSVQLMSHFPLLLLFTLSFPSTSAPHGPQPYPLYSYTLSHFSTSYIRPSFPRNPFITYSVGTHCLDFYRI